MDLQQIYGISLGTVGFAMLAASAGGLAGAFLGELLYLVLERH